MVTNSPKHFAHRLAEDVCAAFSFGSPASRLGAACAVQLARRYHSPREVDWAVVIEEADATLRGCFESLTERDDEELRGFFDRFAVAVTGS